MYFFGTLLIIKSRIFISVQSVDLLALKPEMTYIVSGGALKSTRSLHIFGYNSYNVSWGHLRNCFLAFLHIACSGIFVNY